MEVNVFEGIYLLAEITLPQLIIRQTDAWTFAQFKITIYTSSMNMHHMDVMLTLHKRLKTNKGMKIEEWKRKWSTQTQ